MNSIQFTSDYFDLTTGLTSVRAMFIITDNLNGGSVYVNNSPLIGEETASRDFTLAIPNDTVYDISIDGSVPNTGKAAAKGNDPTGDAGSGGILNRNIYLGLSVPEKSGELMWYVQWDQTQNVDYIGRFVSSSSGNHDLIGDFGEIILMDSVPSTETRQKLEGYLAWKWGLEANLPAGHPYKNTSPGGTGAIANLAPTGISETTATFNANLDASGTNYDVTVYYGTSDGGTNVGSWGASALVGSWTNEASSVSYAASGLASGTPYHYAFMASNATETVWASPSWTLRTLSTAIPEGTGTLLLFR